ncbi:gliding motility-associated ABC transporter ATP-binding subunit GldA [Polluticaenibacter yanchengensis]|uniref:Gliding motility-associated ABC transporter ATP-binding subunit GldA n=1 Tax=Polluticaenibacter yanchengensis TaxID=3014562 RepID=A0ABT4UHG6_9BACT|nr:gliding motility-associated ABC transporter ATP-binding subunit GldA [Chitinophagaceae bacterium LY-5]
MSVKINNLLKIYGSQTAVNNISFEANKGDVLGFLGPNGAGKSTTMKIITGYLQADGGNVEVCGINVKESPLAAKRKIGYLPESNALYYDMFVKEYLEFVAGVYHVANKKQRIADCIEQVGLNLEASKKIGQLSKGYKQRVGLAAALIHDPEVLILDEPTSGLDPNQIVEIREVIRQLGTQKTVILSTHIMQEVEAICSRLVIINRGNLVANDTLQNLRKGAEIPQLKISFAETVDIHLLKSVLGNATIQAADNRTFIIGIKDIEQARKTLLQAAVTNHLNIESLQQVGYSLEAVFRNLTQNN